MRRSAALLGAAALASCSPPPTAGPQWEADAAPSVKLSPNEIGPGIVIEVTATRRPAPPELAITCTGEDPPSVQFNFGDTPSPPPPLRGIFATFRSPTGTPERLELAWGGMEGWWSIREGQEEREAAIIRRFLRGNDLLADFDDHTRAGTRVTWPYAPIGEHRVEIDRWCGRS